MEAVRAQVKAQLAGGSGPNQLDQPSAKSTANAAGKNGQRTEEASTIAKKTTTAQNQENAINLKPFTITTRPFVVKTDKLPTIQAKGELGVKEKKENEKAVEIQEDTSTKPNPIVLNTRCQFGIYS